MAEEIGFENGRNSNFQGLVTLTLTLDPAIRHTVVHHSSTSTYIPNFIQIEETFCGRTDGRTFFPPLILFGQLLEVDLNMFGDRHGARYKNSQNLDRCDPFDGRYQWWLLKTVLPCSYVANPASIRLRQGDTQCF